VLTLSGPGDRGSSGRGGKNSSLLVIEWWGEGTRLNPVELGEPDGTEAAGASELFSARDGDTAAVLSDPGE
jgi:hypothetical protein